MDDQELKLLEDELWEAADPLRANSKLTASEYRGATKWAICVTVHRPRRG